MTIAGVGRSMLHVVQDVGRHVLVEPVQEGRLRAQRWPRGLAPVVLAALAGYILAALCVVLAGPLRASLELSASTGTVDLAVPRAMVGPILVLLVLSLSLAQTAALHGPLWLGVVMTLLTSVVLLAFGAADARVGTTLSPGRAASVIAAVAVWVLLIARRRRRFAWGEFAAVFALIAAAVTVPLWALSVAAQSLGVEAGVVMLASMLQVIGMLAVPASLAAGAAVVKLSCTMATVSVESVRTRLPAVVGFALLIALVVWRVWASIAEIALGVVGVVPLVAALVLLGVTGGAWATLAGLRGAALRAQPEQFESRFGRISQPLAIFLTIGVFPTAIVYTLSFVLSAYTFAEWPSDVLGAIGALLSSRTVLWGTRLVVGIVLLVLAVRGARAGAHVAPELYAAIGIVIVWVSVIGLLGAEGSLWTNESLTISVTAVALALLAWWGARKRLTAVRAAAVGMALLIAALFDQRTFVADPLQALLGFTGFAFVLFGFVWTLLTEAGEANGTSPRYPRPTRVLLVLSNALFGVTVLAYAALARTTAFPIDVTALAALGDQLLGTGLLTAALLAALATAVGIQSPPEEPRTGRKTPAAVPLGDTPA